MGVLLWKEWREQRLMLAVILALAAVLGVSQLVTKWMAGSQGASLCLLLTPLVLGAAVAGSENARGRHAFLAANAVDLGRVWLAKLLFGLAFTIVASCALVPLGTFQKLDLGAAGVGADAFLYFACAGVGIYSLAHYCGCWLRSGVAAIVIGVLLGLGLAGATAINPFLWCYAAHPIPEWLIAGLVFIFSVCLFYMARRRFLAVLAGGAPATAFQCVWWFVQPVLLLGVLPSLAGAGVLVADVLRVDPTDLGHIRSIAASPDGGDVVVFGSLARRHRWLSRFVGTVAITVPTRGGKARRLFMGHREVRPGYLDMWSPDSKRMLVVVERPEGQHEVKSRYTRFGVFVVAAQTVELLPDLDYQWLMWSRDGALLFVSREVDGGFLLGSWDPRTAKTKTSPLPIKFRSKQQSCMGFVDDPPRTVFEDAPQPEDGSNRAVIVVDVATKRVTQHEIGGYTGSMGIMPGQTRPMLWPLSREGKRNLPPLWLDLDSGRTEPMPALGEGPMQGWQGMSISLVNQGSWWLVTPRAEEDRSSHDWYAIDAASGKVFRHPPPAPASSWRSCSNADWLASRLTKGSGRRMIRGVLMQPLRDTDPDRRVVVSARAWPRREIRGATWLNDHELAFAVGLSDRDFDLGRYGPFPACAVLAVDPASKRIRVLWGRSGARHYWQVISWKSWQEMKP